MVRGELTGQTVQRRNKWQPILPESAGKPNPRDVILHPTTGEQHFCLVPEIVVPNGPLFPSGKVVLFHGRHHGKSGYGIEHIWARHFLGVKDLANATAQIATFVSLVLISGTDVYYEYNPDRPDNLATLRSAHGVVGIMCRDRTSAEPYYSVVTAIPGKKNVNGSLVGAVR